MNTKRTVQTSRELVAAVADLQINSIYVAGEIIDVPTIHLSPGQKLIGANAKAALHFSNGMDGILLTADNELKDLTLISDADRRVIFSDNADFYCGSLVLINLNVKGRIQVLTNEEME